MTTSTSLNSAAFKLLVDLEANNDRDWYAAHRDDFKRELLLPVQAILEAATIRLATTTLPLRGSKQSMFRMHRDTRFSANKLPYKLNVGGVLTADGTKKMADGLVYLHCDATGGFVAAGFYLPDTQRLASIRQRMIDEPKLWSKVLTGLDKARLSLSREHVLKSMPRGFGDASDHEHVDSLKLKSLVVQRPLTKKAWTSDGAVDAVVALAKVARPLIEFGRDAA